MAQVAVNAISKSLCEKAQVEKVAKDVASTSARLVATSRAKADPSDPTQQVIILKDETVFFFFIFFLIFFYKKQLAGAQKRVAQISAVLVAVGGEYEEYLNAPAIDPLKVEEEAIQQQIKILQLQKRIAKQVILVFETYTCSILNNVFLF